MPAAGTLLTAGRGHKIHSWISVLRTAWWRLLRARRNRVYLLDSYWKNKLERDWNGLGTFIPPLWQVYCKGKCPNARIPVIILVDLVALQVNGSLNHVYSHIMVEQNGDCLLKFGTGRLQKGCICYNQDHVFLRRTFGKYRTVIPTREERYKDWPQWLIKGQVWFTDGACNQLGTVCAGTKTILLKEASHLSVEWVNVQIQAAGSNRLNQLSSLRSKMKQHEDSSSLLAIEWTLDCPVQVLTEPASCALLPHPHVKKARIFRSPSLIAKIRYRFPLIGQIVH